MTHQNFRQNCREGKVTWKKKPSELKKGKKERGEKKENKKKKGKR